MTEYLKVSFGCRFCYTVYQGFPARNRCLLKTALFVFFLEVRVTIAFLSAPKFSTRGLLQFSRDRRLIKGGNKYFLQNLPIVQKLSEKRKARGSCEYHPKRIAPLRWKHHDLK